jgi:hypothetical protein
MYGLFKMMSVAQTEGKASNDRMINELERVCKETVVV